MADDPFADFGEATGGAMPAPPAARAAPAPKDENDPFAAFPEADEPVSGAQAFGRSFGAGVLPAAGGILGAAAAGGAYGAIGGPGGALAGAAVGLVGGLAGSYGAERAQSYALHEMPDDWQEAIGQSDRDQRLSQEQHPYASFLGGLAPFALTLKPTIVNRGPPNATNLEKLLSNPWAARAFSGGIMGGVQTAQDVYTDQFDWRRSAIATGFGVVFANPNRLGQAIESFGARVGGLGRAPHDAAAAVPPGVAEAAGVHPDELAEYDPWAARQDIEDAQSRQQFENFPEPLVSGYAPDLLDQGEETDRYARPWTLADVWDMGVFGPGNTEETASGGVERDPTSVEQAHEAAQAVAPRQVPDPDVEARRMEPELFGDYDRARNNVEVLRSELQRAQSPNVTDVVAAEDRVAEIQSRLPKEGDYQGGRRSRQLRADLRDAQRQLEELNARRDAFAQGSAEDNPQLSAMRAALLKADEALRDVSRKVAGVRRMAAERVGAPVVERAMFEEPAAAPIEQAPAPTAPSANKPNANAAPTLAEEATQAPATFEPITPAQNETAETPASQPAPRRSRSPAREPEPTPAPPADQAGVGPRTLDEQRAAIADDVAQRMRQSGRPDDEARRWGEITAEHYVTRAARMRGGIGQAEDLYRQSVRIDEAAGAREKRIGGNVVQGEVARRAWPRIVRLFKDADASTVVHENGHVWLDEMQSDAAHELATEVVKRDWETVSRWLKIKEGQPIPRAGQEKFARSFEQYMREGTAPTARLAYAFERFKTWLTKLYKTLDRLGEPINDEVRGVFDRLLTEQPQHVTFSHERPTGGQMWNVHTGEAMHAEAPDADALADRMAAERLHAAPETPEAADEIQKASVQVENERAEASGERSTADAGGEAAAGDGGSRALGAGGGEAGNEPGRGGVGGGAGAQRVGGDADAREGGGVEQSGARDRSGSEPFPLAPRSKPGFGDRDTPWVGKRGNIRVENLTSKADVVGAINEAVDRTPGTDDVLTRGEMQRVAEQFGFDPKEVTREHFEQVFGGVRDLAAKVRALRQAVVDQAGAVASARDAAVQTGKPEDVLRFGQEMNRLGMFTSFLSPVTTELGRGLGMGFSKIEGGADAAALSEIAKQSTGKTLYQLLMEAKMAKNLDSPAKLTKWMRDSQQRSFGRMMLEYFVNNLISGVPTHVTYVIGGQALLLNKAVPETLTASLVGKVRTMMAASNVGVIRALGHEGTSVYAGEAIAQAQEYWRALPKAAQAAIEAAKSGLTTSLPGEAAHPQRLLQGDVEMTAETQQRIERWFLDQRMKTEPRDKAEATRRAKEGERLKDVEPLAPFGDDEDTLVRVSKNLLNADVGWGEAKGDLFGLMRGIKDGMIANGALIKAGGDPNAPAVGLSFSPGRQIPDVQVKGVTVPVGSLVNLPSRGVAMLHSGQRTITYSTDLNAQAWRAATDEGLTGDAFNARVAYLRQNPSQEMMEASHLAANQITLMDQSGDFSKRLTHLFNIPVKLPLLGETPIFRFINPFVQVAANIMDRALVQRTPIGLLAPSIREALMSKDNVLADTTAARMMVGTAYAVGIGFLAMEGSVTGSGPMDPGRRQVWQMAGNQAHSVRIGDMWYDVHRLGPLGLLLGIGADMYDVAHIAKEGQFATAAAMFNHAIVQNMLDESFLRGPAELINVIENPQEHGEKYIQGLVSNFVPMSVGMSYLARSVDPYTRMTRSVVSAMKAKLPGVSETLLPKVDLWGNDIPNEPAFGGRGLTALYMREMSHDPVNIALDQAGIGIASARQFVAGVQLDDQQFHEFSRAAGVMTYQRLREWVLSPDWRNMTPDVKRQHVAEIVQQCRNTARGLLQMKYPDLLTKAANVKSNRFGERF